MDEHDPLIERLRGLGRQPLDPAAASRHLSAMAGVGGRSALAVKLKVGAAFFAGLLLGGTGLATAGALPGPAQDVAHTALSKVGLDVPRGHGPARYNGPECGTDPQTNQPFRNHGQYVRAHAGDPKADASRCGKPIQAGTSTTDGTEAPESSQGGPPGLAHANHGKGRPDDSTERTTPSTTKPSSHATPTTTAPTTTAPAAPAPAAPTTTSTTTSSTSTTESSSTSSTTVGSR